MDPQVNNGLGMPEQDKPQINSQPGVFVPQNTTTSPIIESQSTVVSTARHGFAQRLLGSPSEADFNGTHYLLMYALSLGLVTSILSGVASLLEICFNYVGSVDSTSTGGFSGYIIKLLTWAIINLVVATPVYIFLLFRLRKYQPEVLPLFTRRVRGLLFGVFMTVLGLVTVTSIVNVIYSIVMPFLPKETGEAETAWWPGVLQALIMTTLLGVTFWYQLKSFRGKKGA